MVHPLDTLKTYVSASSEKQHLGSALQTMYRNGGLGRLYTGLLPSLLSTVPFAGISLTVFMQGG